MLHRSKVSLDRRLPMVPTAVAAGAPRGLLFGPMAVGRHAGSAGPPIVGSPKETIDEIIRIHKDRFNRFK
jgi:hypothetical protein